MARQSEVKNLEPVLDAARVWIDQCLIEDGSVFTDNSLWTQPLLSEAREAFVLHPDYGADGFITKLQGQIKDTSTDAKRLMAEVLWALLLFPSGSRPITKRLQIASILGLADRQLPGALPSLSDEVLAGIGSGGPAFNTYRPNELEYLLDLVLDLKGRSHEVRKHIFADYHAFMEWMSSVERKGDRQYRHMLRYFAFPDLVERMSTNTDRRLVLDGFGKEQFKATKSWSDVQLDQALLALRQELQAKYANSVLDFYEPPLREVWAADRKSAVITSGPVPIIVPSNEDEDNEEGDTVDIASDSPRQSHKIQAALAEIGAKMGLKVWLPPGDRATVTSLMDADSQKLILDKLPLYADAGTLKTVTQIDVIWLNRASIVRAFEVEHTTAVYSGLLRMADLLALQPNMKIDLHIVAAEERKDKVFAEMLRPVFSRLEAGPLYKTCSFISYDSVLAIRGLKMLQHTAPTIIAEYEERAQIENI